ncbi:hypothetical protein AAIH32_14125 [Pseudarthrobacter oxydans]|uniref:hypothetical protein n=1 Tax=Pseudarthrobacter oxydans TaxID=1671 RepID=UPI003D29CB01
MFLATMLTADLKFDAGRADSRKLDIDLEEVDEDVSASMRKARAGFALVIGGRSPRGAAVRPTRRRSAGRLFYYRMVGKLDPGSAAEALTVPIGRGAEYSRARHSIPFCRRRSVTPISSGPTGRAL